MKAKRRRHDPEFKARVALEALKGIKTIQQIAKDFDVHPVQVSEWKKTMTAGAAGVFGAGGAKAETEARPGVVCRHHLHSDARRRGGSNKSRFRRAEEPTSTLAAPRSASLPRALPPKISREATFL
jgi:transposase-like protein